MSFITILKGPQVISTMSSSLASSSTGAVETYTHAAPRATLIAVAKGIDKMFASTEYKHAYVGSFACLLFGSRGYAGKLECVTTMPAQRIAALFNAQQSQEYVSSQYNRINLI